MLLPVKIATAHGVTLNPQIEEQIRDKAEGLNRFFDRITSCRVTVEGPPRHHRKGGPFSVRIDLTVPGDELVVDRQEDTDLQAAVQASFSAAQRRLEDFARRHRGA